MPHFGIFFLLRRVPCVVLVEDTVEIGALDCESLVAAEDAPELQFAISVDEVTI